MTVTQAVRTSWKLGPTRTWSHTCGIYEEYISLHSGPTCHFCPWEKYKSPSSHCRGMPAPSLGGPGGVKAVDVVPSLWMKIQPLLIPGKH